MYEIIKEKENLIAEFSNFENRTSRLNLNPDWYQKLTYTHKLLILQLENLKDAFFTLDLNYRFTYFNYYAAYLLKDIGIDIIGRQLSDVFPQTNWDLIKNKYDSCKNEEKPIYLEQYIFSLKRWFGARIYPTQNGPIVLFFDITIRKQKDFLLKEKDKMYRLLIQNMSDVVFTLDMNLNTTYVSPSVERQLGESVENHLKRKVEEKIPQKQLLMLKNILEEELQKENDPTCNKSRTVQFESKHFKADGSYIWLSMILSFLRDSDGKIIGIQGVNHDISLQKSIEKELRKSEKKLKIVNKELLALNEKLNLKNSELEKTLDKSRESDRLKSAFLANLSHEIRTPMNGIMGFSQLLKEQELEHDQQMEYLQIISQCSRSLLDTIDNIMNISKIELNQIRLFYSLASIKEKIKQVADMFIPEIQMKKISIIQSVKKNDVVIYTDHQKLVDILINLTKNAIKFTPEGTIKLGYRFRKIGTSNELLFFVKDTGTGIKKEQQEFIFERFRKGEESISRNIEGTGLGLTISKSYVEILGGRIWVESEVGKGSTFFFTIPINSTNSPKDK